jgi:hypothetical protein
MANHLRVSLKCTLCDCMSVIAIWEIANNQHKNWYLIILSIEKFRDLKFYIIKMIHNEYFGAENPDTRAEK